MPQRRVKKEADEPKPPKYLAIDKAGVAHAVGWHGAKEAFCGLKLFNFHKRVGLERVEYDNGWTYEPPPDVKVTCLACLGHAQP